MEIGLLPTYFYHRDQTYRPGGYTNFYIYEPKRRLVSAAPFRDRVVHHALCRVIEPIWEARFINTSFACRVGRGVHKALDQAHTWARRYRYAFQGDIVKYFPSIDHQILRALLARHIADRRVMDLIDLILDSGAGLLQGEYPLTYFPGDDLFAAKGSDERSASAVAHLCQDLRLPAVAHSGDAQVSQVTTLPAGRAVEYDGP